jgi:uncharacterized membrane protein
MPTTVAMAIAVHVLSVIWWIGGLALVTAVVLPALRSGDLGDARTAFHAIESRFEPQARIAVLLAGLSGSYLMIRLQLWGSFLQARYWWLDAMVLFWLLFMVMLFLVGPAKLLERAARQGGDDRRVWQRMQRTHLLLLVIALIIIGGAVAGSHGF